MFLYQKKKSFATQFEPWKKSYKLP